MRPPAVQTLSAVKPQAPASLVEAPVVGIGDRQVMMEAQELGPGDRKAALEADFLANADGATQAQIDEANAQTEAEPTVQSEPETATTGEPGEQEAAAAPEESNADPFTDASAPLVGTESAPAQRNPTAGQRPPQQQQRPTGGQAPKAGAAATGGQPQQLAFQIHRPKPGTRYMNMLVYGEFGVGKTTFAATAEDVPEMRDVLYIDAESGELTLQNRANLDVITVNQYRQFARIREFLAAHCKYRDTNNEAELLRLDQMLRAPGEEPVLRKYRTVVIDSISEVYKYCMYQLLSINQNTAKLDAEPDAPEFGEWGKATEMMRLMVRSFRDLPMNVIFIGSEKAVEEKVNGQVVRTKIGINLPRSLAGEVPGFLDAVGYLAVGKVPPDNRTVRRLYLASGQRFMAKHRFVNFKEEYLDDPSLAKLVALAKGQ